MMTTPNERSEEPQSWPGHVRATAVLALPLIGAQLAQMAMGVTDTVMIGWLGAPELAGSVLGTQAFFLVYIFGVGFGQAAMPLAAAAEGQGDAARRPPLDPHGPLGAGALQRARHAAALAHRSASCWRSARSRRSPALAGTYMRVVQWGMLPALLVMGLRSYLTVVGRAYVVLAVVVFGALCNAFLDYALIFGHFGAPALGIVGAALATAVTNLVMAALLFAYTALAPGLRRYELYARFWRPDWDAFPEILRLGWPIGATIIAEVGLFSASSLMMGWIGTIPLAAHGIALQIASIAFMVPLGLASAATVRVGLALGRGDATDLGRAGNTALVLADR